MKALLKENILPVFFGLSACSWVPHWACHYYRLETGTTFVVANWNFSPAESVISLVVYGMLTVINLAAVSKVELRILTAVITGLCHLLIGSVHLYRLWHPFPFEVFGYPWSHGASLREAAIVIPFGLLCWVIASGIFKTKNYDAQRR